MEQTTTEVPVSEAAPAYPTLKESWAGLGWLVLITLLLAVAVLLPAKALGLHGTPRLALTLGLTVGANVLAALWLQRKAGPARWLPVRWRGPREPWQAYALLLLIVPAEAVLLSMQHFLHLPQWSAQKLFSSLALHPLLALGLGCVAAPATEELLFRGILLRGLLRNYRPAVAIAQSALLFGIMHFNPAQSLNALLLGLLLGWLYYKSRSLLLCIGLHGLHNALAFASMLPHKVSSQTAALLTNQLAYVALLGLAALVLATSLGALGKKLAASTASR